MGPASRLTTRRPTQKRTTAPAAGIALVHRTVAASEKKKKGEKQKRPALGARATSPMLTTGAARAQATGAAVHRRVADVLNAPRAGAFVHAAAQAGEFLFRSGAWRPAHDIIHLPFDVQFCTLRTRW